MNNAEIKTCPIFKHAPFYAGVAALGFLLGWHVAHWLTTFGEEFDSRIEGRW